MTKSMRHTIENSRNKLTVFPCFSFTTAFREMMLEADLLRTIVEPTLSGGAVRRCVVWCGVRR